LNKQFGQYGIEITSISVTNVHLPREFAETMQEATVWHNRNEYKLLQQEYDIKKIEAREAEAQHKQKVKEDLEKIDAEWNRDLASERKLLENEKATTKKTLAELNETEKAKTLEINTQSRKDVADINRKRDVLLAQKKSEGSAESERIRVEADIFVLDAKANADAQVANFNATALEITGTAEMKAVQGLGPKRVYDQKMRALQSLRGLASNPDVAIAGNNGDNAVAQLLSGSRTGGVLGLNV
jgi:vacuolar-type H+-ATPase subunit I/STV1